MTVVRGIRLIGKQTPDVPIVTLSVTLGSSNPATVSFAPMKYDKKSAAMMVKDDGAVDDYNIGYAYLKGGIVAVDGQTYPGVTYTDGCHKDIPYKLTYAINSNQPRTGVTPYDYLTSWAQYREMVEGGFELANHSWEHSGYNKLVQVKQNEYNVYDNTGYALRTFVVPTNDEGYANVAPYLGYLNVGSSFGDPARDDFEGADDANNVYGVYWGMSTLLNTRTFNRHGSLLNRGFANQWDQTNDLSAIEGFIDDSISKSAAGNANYLVHWFSHELTRPSGGFQGFKDLVTYLKNHPGNNDTVWVTGMQEFGEYYEVKELATMTYTQNANDLTITIDTSNISGKNRLKDMTLLIGNSPVYEVLQEGADSVTWNANMINVYKKTKHVSNPHNDILPPQINSAVKSGNNLIITYNRSVTQSQFSNSKGNAYTVAGTTISSITGEGTVWTLACTSTPGSTFDYRMQRGNAQDALGYKVCTYIGYPITSA